MQIGGVMRTKIVTAKPDETAGSAIERMLEAGIGSIVVCEGPSLVRPTLGNLIAESTSSVIGRYNVLGLGWWAWTSPAAVLVAILVCTNLVGDGLDAALNLRRRR